MNDDCVPFFTRVLKDLTSRHGDDGDGRGGPRWVRGLMTKAAKSDPERRSASRGVDPHGARGLPWAPVGPPWAPMGPLFMNSPMFMNIVHVSPRFSCLTKNIPKQLLVITRLY